MVAASRQGLYTGIAKTSPVRAPKTESIAMPTISPQSALVYAMVIVSAADRNMSDSELRRIGDITRLMPAFVGYEEGALMRDAKACADILDNDDGLGAVLGLIREAVPTTHSDLVYVVACDIAVVDGELTQEELRILEMIRHQLSIDRLTAAAIERGVAARRKVFPS